MSNSILGVKEIDLVYNNDKRGFFLEFFKASKLHQTLDNFFQINQFNLSVSKKNTFRGIHFSNSINPQHKFVTCIQGEIIDFIIDLRLGSPTFGVFQKFKLNSRVAKAIYIPSGCGHGFLVNKDDSVVIYAQSSEYSPNYEHSLNYLDDSLGIKSEMISTPIISEKDLKAPSLSELIHLKLLPNYIV